MPTAKFRSATVSVWSRKRCCISRFSPASSSFSAAYSRIVSSIRNLAWPSASGSRITRDLSTSAATVSRMADRGTSSSVHTASAISSDQPAKTDSRRSSACSRSVSRSWLQSMAARSVCWRGGAARSPVVSSRNRSSTRIRDLFHRQRADPGGGQLDRQRDAVQRPADRRHRGARWLGSARNRARSPRRVRRTAATASAGADRARPAGRPAAGPARRVSPATRSGSRLVAGSAQVGRGARSSRWQSRAQASSRCSQLSSASSIVRGLQRVGERVKQRRGPSPRPRRPRTRPAPPRGRGW